MIATVLIVLGALVIAVAGGALLDAPIQAS
jgi:hypothetical protein